MKQFAVSFGALSLAGVLGVFGAASCADEDGLATGQPGATNHGGGSTGGSGTTEPCEEGATRECTEEPPAQGLVQSCLTGTQTCVDGAWSPCMADPPPAEGNAKPLAISGAAVPCYPAPNNCDTTCMVYEEDPSPDFVSGSGTGFGSPFLYGGDITDLDSEFDWGHAGSCRDMHDCQFDTYCEEPQATNCDIANICVVDDINGPSPTDMDCTAQRCIDAICAVDDTLVPGLDCCDPDAADLAGNLLGWEAQCVDMVETVCHMDCNAGTTDRTCRIWDWGFVAAAAPDVAANSLPAGCAGLPDLTVGVGCRHQGLVCNRGNAPAVGPIKVLVYDEDDWSSDPVDNPPTTTEPVYRTCTLNLTIQPGECRNFSSSNCSPGGTLHGTTSDKDLTAVVNPIDGTQIAECNTENNWGGIDHDLSCIQKCRIDNVWGDHWDNSPSECVDELEWWMDGAVNFDKHNLQHTPFAVTFVNVADAAACTAATNEWYYDNNADIEVIHLCPSTCTEVQTNGTDLYIVNDPDNTTATNNRRWNELSDFQADCMADLASEADDDPEDFSLNYVVYNGAVAPAAITMTRVTDAAACTGATDEWYYDDNSSPDYMHMCPAACTAFRTSPYRLERFFDCIPLGGGQTVVDGSDGASYSVMCDVDGDGVADQDRHVQWTYLTWQTNPGGGAGTVDIEFRSAETPAALSSQSFIYLGDANGTLPEDCDPYTQPCADLYTTLFPLGQAHGSEAELRFTLTSPGGAPIALESWKLYYSCPFSE